MVQIGDISLEVRLAVNLTVDALRAIWRVSGRILRDPVADPLGGTLRPTGSPGTPSAYFSTKTCRLTSAR